MNEKEIIFGKHVLESLSVGMYSDPLTIYREYIQNASDSLDKAINENIITKEEAVINVVVDKEQKLISIKDNGTGIQSELAYNILLDVANSQKNYKETRGFRGIGRLGGLGCSKNLVFITSSPGEKIKSVITWDCDLLIEMLNLDNRDVKTALEVIQKVTKFEQLIDTPDSHYFEVRLEGIYSDYDELLELKTVEHYLSTVAPVPFDSQMFHFAPQIKEKLSEYSKSPEEYRIFINNSKKPIFKQYKTSFKTGHQERTKKNDYITDVRFFQKLENDTLFYLGWYAVTNYYGSVDDPFMQGIRLRKGNILIGNESTFGKFFNEGDRANSWFIGEVYLYNPDLIPNAKRDDFERNKTFSKLDRFLRQFADELNKNIRRTMSQYHSAIRGIEELAYHAESIKTELVNGGISSDIKKEKLLSDKEIIEKRIDTKSKDLERILQKENLDDHLKDKAKDTLKKAKEISQQFLELENDIINADYGTKNDLPTCYTREERKLYQRIIAIVDEFFINDKSIAEQLRQKIREELSEKKKR